MNDLIINATKTTPQITFLVEKKILEIKGDSYPEYAFNFFKKPLEWIDNYFQIKSKAEIIFKLPYFNTSTTKSIYDILDKLESFMKTGKDINVTWFYKTGEDDMYKQASRILNKFKIPYKIIEVEKII